MHIPVFIASLLTTAASPSWYLMTMALTFTLIFDCQAKQLLVPSTAAWLKCTVFIYVKLCEIMSSLSFLEIWKEPLHQCSMRIALLAKNTCLTFSALQTKRMTFTDGLCTKQEQTRPSEALNHHPLYQISRRIHKIAKSCVKSYRRCKMPCCVRCAWTLHYPFCSDHVGI